MDAATVAKFQKTIADFEQATGKTAEEGMRTIARTCLKRLATTVQPFGLSGSGKMEKFKKSIANQVDRAWLGTNFGYLPATNNMKDAHYGARRNGSVPKATYSLQVGNPPLDLISISERETYKKAAVAKAFRAKAAWVKAHNDLGGRKMAGISPMIARHLNGARGEKQVTGQGVSTKIIVSNNTTYISSIQSTRDVAAAVAQGLITGLKWMKKTTDKSIEKANRALK